MEKYICWKHEDIPVIMNTDADFTPDHIFTAVHTPVTIKKRTGGAGSPAIFYTQEDLLKDFQNEGTTHLFVPILGVSGSGKSHLVHWLKTQLQPSSSKVEVLLIPKSGTNLKSILSYIIGQREGSSFDEYRKRLSQTSSQLDESGGRTELLNKLATQIDHLPTHFFTDKLGSTYSHDYIEYAKSGLPDLLYDIYFRENHWLKERGVIARLYQLALGANHRERVEERRQFEKKDLPLDVTEFTQAAKKAQDFLRTLVGMEELQEVSVQLLNEALNEAVRDLLVGNQNLTELMMDVRRQLYQEGISLILLIEDFAKMQGIDGSVLEAIIQRATPENKLCPMKTALACTDGYFENIPETFKTRADFTIWVEYDNANQVNYNSFLAPYMNAIRLGQNKLLIEHESLKKTQKEQNFNISNACDECKFKPQCHNAFGDYNGIGLYPFNEEAALNLYKRLNSAGFTPREFIGKTVKEVMYRFAFRIKEGGFPNNDLLTYFGGDLKILQPIKKQDIEKKFKADSEKLIPLIEFWSYAGGRVKQEISQAFSLPSIDSISSEGGGGPAEQPKPVEPLKLELTYPKSFYNIHDWSNGVRLDQDAQRSLRKLLHSAPLFKKAITKRQN